MTKFKNNVIGDNTPENVEYLKGLGYDFLTGFYDKNDNCICTIQELEGSVFYSIQEDNETTQIGYIDCRGNSPLFRDKTAERREG